MQNLSHGRQILEALVTAPQHLDSEIPVVPPGQKPAQLRNPTHRGMEVHGHGRNIGCPRVRGNRGHAIP